jgi:hypothetical protein
MLESWTIQKEEQIRTELNFKNVSYCRKLEILKKLRILDKTY